MDKNKEYDMWIKDVAAGIVDWTGKYVTPIYLELEGQPYLIGTGNYFDFPRGKILETNEHVALASDKNYHSLKAIMKSPANWLTQRRKAILTILLRGK
jgi:hypothetical protein